MADRTLPLIIPDKPLDTVKIASDETAMGYLIINAVDFDAETMTLYGSKAPTERKAPKGA